MRALAKEGLLDQLSKVKLPRCESSPASNAATKNFGKVSSAPSPLELIHSDIYRPKNVKAHHGTFYFLTFIDNYSRYGMRTYYCIARIHLMCLNILLLRQRPC